MSDPLDLQTYNVVAIRHGKKRDLGFGTTSWSLESQLAEAGYETAKKVVSRLGDFLAGCQLFFCSPVIRAQQTAFTIMQELGIPSSALEAHIRYESRLWSGYPSVWYDEDADNYCNAKIYAKDPEMVEMEGARVLAGIREAANVLRQCEVLPPVALVVSHGGPLDAAIMLSKRTLRKGNYQIGDVAEDDGALFTFNAEGALIGVTDLATLYAELNCMLK